ncbi:MAG TPA: glycosyltransferase family 4 protein [Patescibacteria group bacterium]|nr:glycosyltransferase family 4 protein [Patescibacteria group bacterium]
MVNIKIFALAALGKGLSGSDRIFIEFARRWQKNGNIIIYVNEEGREMCRRQNLQESQGLKYVIWKTPKKAKSQFLITYFYRVFRSIFESFKTKLVNSPETILYSASEFWMDSLPAFILKIRYPKVIWAASWYQTAPNPLVGFAEGKREKAYNFSAFLYFFAQLPVKPLVANFSDCVLVNNEEERKKQFPRLNKLGRAIVVIGAIDLEGIRKWIKSHGKSKKTYDAVFQGRFHPQKGVVELIEIWKKVVTIKPNSKLAMIGDGPLMGDVKEKIRNLKLSKNIKLFGYVFDGDEKYNIFSKSKIVVHPAFYDSGGMASAEAMAFELPCIGFDLESYRSYYPKGMIKVKIGDLKKFAETILDTLDNSQKRNRVGKEALTMIRKNWSWDKRASEVLELIK